ncbi:MAG: phage portal protein [Gammaproteobacteria bacterium]|uniref:Putative portal protein n=1 Tax=viral metagenome TaxID=1070528 RepID=A0A6M3KKS8_9ZZZZ|nr:phage portal protein [Gammaproteobacteria bacterium]MBU1505926.1 phage portal protein [Gammaproteobacteria bacterium]MBU2119854.1 phage portal protein [Gammaproteobacteria bacterium]MBU2189768.1 phage portal protein [Gammaproteobacteria bacterium]
MAKRQGRTARSAPMAAMQAAPQGGGMEAFSFGDPVPVMDGRELMDYAETWLNGKWYEPPMSWEGLARSFRASTHHSSALYFKRNVLASTFIPHKLLDRATFSKWALDFLTFGNAYLERRPNMLGDNLGLDHSLAKYVRRGADLDAYFYVHGFKTEHEFKKGSVFHLMECDINQEIYGLPEYLATLQAAWLNESATLFRRRYFNNGSHAGFIMYITDPAHQQADVDSIREALKQSKGPGNFRNLFMYAPNGKKDGIQIIPVGEVAAKDDFINIKNVSRDDVLAAHRIPPQLMGIVPGNTGGFGAILPAAQVFARNEIEPLQAKFRELNDWLGQEVVRFEPYVVPVTGEKEDAAK